MLYILGIWVDLEDSRWKDGYQQEKQQKKRNLH
jgi:hypothetical protein